MTKNNKKSLLALVSCAAFTAAACGSSGVNSGVPGNKTVEEISDEEAEMVCEATFDYLDVKFPVQRRCELVAGYVAAAQELAAGEFGDEELQQACQEAADDCVANGDDEMLGFGDADATCAGSMGGVDGCDATVSEVEQCLTDGINATVALVDEQFVRCSELESSDLIALVTDMPDLEAETPASCETLEEKCPEANFSSGVEFSMDDISGGTDDSDPTDGMGGMGGAEQ